MANTTVKHLLRCEIPLGVFAVGIIFAGTFDNFLLLMTLLGLAIIYSACDIAYHTYKLKQERLTPKQKALKEFIND